MAGLFNPKHSEFRSIFAIVFVEYLGRGIVRRVALFIFPKSGFARGIELLKQPPSEEEKKGCKSTVACV